MLHDHFSSSSDSLVLYDTMRIKLGRPELIHVNIVSRQIASTSVKFAPIL